MRIGFDGKRAVQNFTGLGNYSRYVADILCHFYPENDYVLYAPINRTIPAAHSRLSCYFFLEKTKFIVARMGNHLSIGERRY